MAKDLLSDRQIRALRSAPKPFKTADGGGLFLLVQPSGAKLWRWKFRLNGKEGLLALGAYPATGLAAARQGRDAARALVKQGINPVHQRQEEKQRRITDDENRRRASDGAFGTVARAWLADGQSRWAKGTCRGKKARVERFLLPALAAMPMAAIGAAAIRPILERCRSAGAWAAVHVKGDPSAIFDFAVMRGLADGNPIPSLRALVRMPRSESKAVLSPDQIRLFYSRLKSYRGFPETAICLRLIALTACRPGEAANAEWAEFDEAARLWRRAGGKMKSGRDHVGPISEQTLALLGELRVVTGASRFLFPHRAKDGVHATPARLGYAMRDLNLGVGASPHCWRTTFSTWANENGFRPDAIERQLAHVEGNRVRATYNKALLVDERRRMMQAWASYLDGCRQCAAIAVSAIRAA